MSTTIKRVLIALPMVAAAWLAIMVLVMRVSDAAPAAVVPMPSQTFLSKLPDDVAILDITTTAITLANRPGLTKALYNVGALVVLPAGLTGCLPLSPEQRSALEQR